MTDGEWKRVARIRREIATGSYLTPEKERIACARMAAGLLSRRPEAPILVKMTPESRRAPGPAYAGRGRLAWRSKSIA